MQPNATAIELTGESTPETAWCECGNPIPSGASPPCAQCMWLDGQTTGEYAIIDALRREGGLVSIGAIAARAGYSERVVYHNIKPLVARGRIEKVQVEEAPGRRNLQGGRIRSYFRLVP